MAGVYMPYHLQSVERLVVAAHGSPRELTLAERNILYAYAQAAMTEIEEGWPVDTSTSRDGWSFTVSGRAGYVTWEFENLVDYVEWVHVAGDDEPLVEGYVPEVVDAWLDRMRPVLGAEILATEAAIAASKATGGRGLLDVLQARLSVKLGDLVESVLRG